MVAVSAMPDDENTLKWIDFHFTPLSRAARAKPRQTFFARLP
jgi:hypothetical protein